MSKNKDTDKEVERLEKKFPFPNKKQEEELKSLIDEITFEAKELRLDYEENKSDMSGSVIHIHENSPFLDSNEDGEPVFSGSRWTKVLRGV